VVDDVVRRVVDAGVNSVHHDEEELVEKKKTRGEGAEEARESLSGWLEIEEGDFLRAEIRWEYLSIFDWEFRVLK